MSDAPVIDEEELRSRVRALLEVVHPERADYVTFRRAQFDHGLAWVHFPEGHGGFGLSPKMNQVVRDEIQKNSTVYYDDPPAGLIGIGMGAPTLLTYGPEDLKKELLPRLFTGEDIWCQMFSEPSAGSDVAGLATRAVRDGDEWVVNGQKVWTTVAHLSKWGMLVARTNPDVPKHDGLSYFLVDMEAPGVEVRPLYQITGEAEFNEVFFTDARVPHSRMLGKEGQGWRVAITTLMNERSSIGGSLGGGAGIKDLIKLAQNVDIGDKPAIEDGGVRRKIANFAVRTNGLKFTGQRGLSAVSQGATPGPEASIGKLVAAIMGLEMGAFGMELQGAAGVLTDDESGVDAAWQHSYMAMPGLRLAGGTDEILRNIISERVLGMPGEPRMDKDKPFKDIPTGTAR